MKKHFLILALVVIIAVVFAKNPIDSLITRAVEYEPTSLKSDFLFPSARSYGYYLMPYARFGEYGDERFPDYSAEDVFEFWLAHHDMIVTGYSPGDYKTAEPDRIILGGEMNTAAGFYDYDTDTYFWDGQLTHLNNWINENWENYSWSENFESSEEAYEDCFLHLSPEVESITFTFPATGDDSLTITGYDPANPTRSRIPGAWGSSGWFTNIKSPVYISFWEDFFALEIIEREGGEIDGYFLDVLQWDGYRYFSTDEEFEQIIEFASKSEYNQKLEELTEMTQNILDAYDSDKILVANTWRNLNKDVDPYEFTFEDNVDAYIREGSIIYDMPVSAFEDELKTCQRVGEEGRIVARQHMLSYISDVNRSRIAGLATYYLSMNDNVYFFSNQRYNDPAIDPYGSWFEAIAYDIGEPDGDYYVFAEGQDPSRFTQAYKVFARNFTKGIVLVKPRPTYYNPTSFLSNSITTHALDGVYCSLSVDGTLGDQITSITLRNWEGAILLEEDTTSPEAINDLTAS